MRHVVYNLIVQCTSLNIFNIGLSVFMLVCLQFCSFKDTNLQRKSSKESWPWIFLDKINM